MNPVLTITVQKVSGTPKEIQDIFGIKKATLAILRCQGRGPKYCKPAGRILYKLKDVEEWITHSTIKTQDSDEIEKLSQC